MYDVRLVAAYVKAALSIIVYSSQGAGDLLPSASIQSQTQALGISFTAFVRQSKVCKSGFLVWMLREVHVCMLLYNKHKQENTHAAAVCSSSAVCCLLLLTKKNLVIFFMQSC